MGRGPQSRTGWWPLSLSQQKWGSPSLQDARLERPSLSTPDSPRATILSLCLPFTRTSPMSSDQPPSPPSQPCLSSCFPLAVNIVGARDVHVPHLRRPSGPPRSPHDPQASPPTPSPDAPPCLLLTTFPLSSCGFTTAPSSGSYPSVPPLSHGPLSPGSVRLLPPSPLPPPYADSLSGPGGAEGSSAIALLLSVGFQEAGRFSYYRLCCEAERRSAALTAEKLFNVNSVDAMIARYATPLAPKILTVCPPCPPADLHTPCAQPLHPRPAVFGDTAVAKTCRPQTRR